MAFYYVKNQVGSTNISLRDLYRLKGINLNEDKTDNFRLAPYGSNTEGSHLGPGLNPWLSELNGDDGNSARGGMVEFNDPDGSTNPSSQMSNFRNANFRYSPYNYGSSASFTPKATAGQKSASSATLDTSGLAANWVHSPYLKWYNFEHDDNLNIVRGNWFSIHRRNTLANGIRLHVGYLNATGDNGSIAELSNYTSTTITNVSHGNIAVNNVGQGEGTPYDEAGELGSSTYATVTYRNSAAVTQFRVITLNQNYSQTPSISVSGATTYNNQGGSALLFHSNTGINMGKGVQWTMAHRGANWIKIYYTRLTGTTVNAHNGYNVVTLSSTNTLQLQGALVKISDEAAVIIAPHRNGSSSGNSRRLAAHTLYANGTGKIPTIRSSFAASYDWGSTDGFSCAADVGSSDTDGTVFGLAVYARSGTSLCYFISWKYVVSTDTFTFISSSIISDGSGYQSNTWRAPHNVIHLGYNNADGNRNYYHVVFSGGSGDYHYTIEQDARNSASGALSITQEAGNIFGSTNIERSYYESLNFEKGMPWFVNKSVASDYSGTGAWLGGIFFDTSDDVRTCATGYSLPGVGGDE